MTEQNMTFPEKEIFIEKFCGIFRENRLDKYLDENKAELFYRLAVILVETNKSLNLTAVTDPDGVILKHFADSLVGADELVLCRAVLGDIDGRRIGSGGFNDFGFGSNFALAAATGRKDRKHGKEKREENN